MRKSNHRPIAFVLASTNHGSMLVNRHDYKHVEEGMIGVGIQILETSSFDQPEIDLINADGYNLSESDYDWELTSLDDGCWADWTFPEDMTEQEQAEIETAWDEDYFDGMEELGWTCDDTEYILQGPLELSDEDGMVVAQGEK